MAITNLTILGNTVYGTPSGNYDGSSADFVSDAVKGVGYYAGQGSLQTAFITTSNLLGVITLQATLDDDPASANWFDVLTFGDASSQITDYYPVNLTGNFVWIRAAITFFEAGSLGVTLSY
jgi:hypothetical protein